MGMGDVKSHHAFFLLEVTMNSLRKTRFFKNVSQHKLSFLAGVHQSRISLIENGLVEPRGDEKRKLAKALGVLVEEIWSERVERKSRHTESRVQALDD